MRQIPTTDHRLRSAPRRPSEHGPHLLLALALTLVGMVALYAPAGTPPYLAHAAPRSLVTHAPAPALPALAQTSHAGAAPCRAVYVVRPGDWLSRIAPRYGLRWPSLATANRLPNPNVIHPGERLCVPASSRHVTSLRHATVKESHTIGAGGKGPPAPSSGSYGPRGDYCPGVSRASAFRVPVVARYAVPAGCFAGVWSVPVGRTGYYPAVAYGQCSWWPSALRRVPNPSADGRTHTAPRVGAIVYWTPAMNRSSVGHYAYIEYVRPDGWMLISEMNMYWRGGGWGKVLFQFVHAQPGLLYIY